MEVTVRDLDIHQMRLRSMQYLAPSTVLCILYSVKTALATRAPSLPSGKKHQQVTRTSRNISARAG